MGDFDQWLTPVCYSRFDLATKGQDGSVVYRKMILPQDFDLHYGGRKIPVDHAYLQDLVRSFKRGAVDPIHFLIEDTMGNHDAGPEQIRATATNLDLAQDGEEPGLYADLRFPSEEAAKAVEASGRRLGVSARILEGMQDGRTGRKFRRVVHSILGTLAPKVGGMSPWRKVDLGVYTSPERTLDLSMTTYDEEQEMPRTRERATTTRRAADTAVLDDLTDEQLEALVADAMEELDGDEDGEDETDLSPENEADDEEEDEVDDEEDEEDEEDEQAPASRTDLSSKARRQIDLAQADATQARNEARTALNALAEGNFANDRTNRWGNVPPAILDLAQPILGRHADSVIDLSQDGGKKMSARKILQKILDEVQGMDLIDLAQGERGYGGHNASDSMAAEEDAILDQWDKDSQ